MSRKHFERLADALASIRPGDDAPTSADTAWTLAVQVVADVCAESNPRFDRARFVAACETRPNYEARS